MITVERYGPWAVIAGGSEGIGAAFARELGRAGVNLVLLARKPEPLEETARLVREESGVTVRTLSMDLTAPDMLEQIRRVTDDLEVGMLVYNAGADNAVRLFVERELEDCLRLVRLNAVGQVACAHHFGKAMVARGRGGVVIIGAMSAFAGAPTHATYGGLKSFGQIFAEGLWWEFKAKGVDVLYVSAGATGTPAMDRLGLNEDPDRRQRPEDLAQGALANLGQGPLYVPPHLREHFARFSALDRAQAVEAMASFLYSYTRSPDLAAGGAH